MFANQTVIHQTVSAPKMWMADNATLIPIVLDLARSAQAGNVRQRLRLLVPSRRRLHVKHNLAAEGAFCISTALLRVLQIRHIALH